MKTNLRLKMLFMLAAMFILIAIFADYLTPYDPYAQNLSRALESPGLQHLLGTDRYGRDLLSRVVAGAKLSILSTLVLVSCTMAVGSLVGFWCGYKGGRVDAVLMRFTDLMLSFPQMVFALAVAAILGGGVQNAVLAVFVVSWPKYARLTRSQVLQIKNSDYLKAARLNGLSNWQIIVRHIVPNTRDTLLITALLDIGTMLMELAGLSFLGLGAAPPAAEWGSMLSNGRSMLQTTPWVVLAPGTAIFTTVLVFNMLGDALRDYLDPRQLH